MGVPKTKILIIENPEQTWVSQTQQMQKSWWLNPCAGGSNALLSRTNLGPVSTAKNFMLNPWCVVTFTHMPEKRTCPIFFGALAII